jgi:hypothetical protein
VRAAIVLLVFAAVLVPGSTAAPSSCNLSTYNCPGYAWSGQTSQGGTNRNTTGSGITFYSNLSKTWLIRVQLGLGQETCTFGGVATTTSLPLAYSPKFPARHGHFSTTWTSPVPSQLGPPPTQLHLVGTFHGNRASGSVHWQFIGTTQAHCSPTSGTFTWRVTNKGKVGNA